MKEEYMSAWECIHKVRTQKPLVTLFTNIVTVNFCANMLLSMGASPIVTLAKEELNDILQATNAFVLNMGTPDSQWLSFAKEVVENNTRNIPIILDPVGVGFTTFRNAIAKDLVAKKKIHVIRGNASEILALATLMGCASNEQKQQKGVDSTHGTQEALPCAKVLAKEYSCIVMISGEVDYITNGIEVISIAGGSAIMPLVTGMGCSLTACIGALCSVAPNTFIGTIAGAMLFSSVGAMVEKNIKTPASFATAFCDALNTCTLDDLVQYSHSI